jgi:anti-anti-sigma factor
MWRCGWTNVRTPARYGPSQSATMGSTHTCDLLRTEDVGRALARGLARFVVDLRDVGRLDASTVRTLVVAARTADGRDGRVVVLCAPGAARETLSVTGLDRHLAVAASRGEAVRLALSNV